MTRQSPDPGVRGGNWRTWLAWAGVLLLALLLRIPGINPALTPWHPDEYNFVYWPLLILLGEHVPPVFYYPHLSYYLLAALNAVQLAVTQTDGGADFDTSTLLRYFWHPEQALALARGVGVAAAVATVAVAGLLARRLGANALLASALMAVCVIHVRQSPIAGADVLMALVFVLALWAALRLETHHQYESYLLAGICAGLAASLKYNGVLVSIAVPVMHLAHRRPAMDMRIAVAAAGAIGAFLLTTPGVALASGAFGGGFVELWHHVSPGQTSTAFGWWHHLSVSLWTAFGPVGLGLCVAGLYVMIRRRAARDLATVAVFLLYFAVIGSAELGFVRYALPLAPLAAVCIALAVTRCGRLAPVAVLLVLAPSLYASVRIADLRWRADTRTEAAAWMAEHVPFGSVVCNFGGWAGDPQVRTFEDIWWKISQLARNDETPSIDRALEVLAAVPPPTVFMSYAIQTSNSDQAAGSLTTAEQLDCDCVVTNDHPLPFSEVTPGLREQLNRSIAEHAHFDAGPDGATARYDIFDAQFVPLSGFGRMRKAGPEVDIWLPEQHMPSHRWTAHDVFARALVRGAQSLVRGGQPETGLHLVQQALSSVPQSRDARLFRDAAAVFADLGLEQPARASAARAAELGL